MKKRKRRRGQKIGVRPLSLTWRFVNKPLISNLITALIFCGGIYIYMTNISVYVDELISGNKTVVSSIATIIMGAGSKIDITAGRKAVVERNSKESTKLALLLLKNQDLKQSLSNCPDEDKYLSIIKEIDSWSAETRDYLLSIDPASAILFVYRDPNYEWKQYSCPGHPHAQGLSNAINNLGIYGNNLRKIYDDLSK